MIGCSQFIRNVIQKDDSKRMLYDLDYDFKLYSQYTHSKVVRDEIDAGVRFDLECIIHKIYYKQSTHEGKCQGHCSYTAALISRRAILKKQNEPTISSFPNI
jgi:hypothetical protein